MMNEIKIIKKDGTEEMYNGQKIIVAVGKSAARIMVTLTPEEEEAILKHVETAIQKSGKDAIPISMMHNLVEAALVAVNEDVAKSYRDYRNYKKEFVHMMDDVYVKSQSIRYIGDKENANTDSALVATKRSLIFNELNKNLYRKFFMTKDELQACKDGYIYVHDQSARLDTINCFERSTRFITDKGVKSFYDFSDGDEVMVPTHKGRWRKAVVHSYGWQPIQAVTLKRCVGLTKTVYVTPNHRWILKDGTETTNLKIEDKLVEVPAMPEFNFEYMSCSDRVWKVENIVPMELNPEDQVWCLEVEEDHSFLLEGGIPTGNCCLFNASEVISGGFEMGNIWYNEPKTLDTFWDVLGDVILATAAQQYGGFTVPEIDKIAAPYAEKSFEKYKKEYCELIGDVLNPEFANSLTEKAEKYAMKKTTRDMEQGYQGIEYKLNTVGSSRGDYPFVTFTFGLGTTVYEKMCSKAILKVHMTGQGKKGFKRPVLFPKLVFLYDKNIHGEGKECRDVFDDGIECSSKTMYPKKIGA